MSLSIPATTTFLFGGAGGFGGKVRCRQFCELSSILPYLDNFHVPSDSPVLRSRCPRPGAISWVLGLWTGLWLGPRSQIWCLEGELGPALGEPDLLSTCNEDLHSSRVSDETGPDFPEEDWVPAEIDPGLPEVGTIQRAGCIWVSEEIQVKSDWQTTDFTL